MSAPHFRVSEEAPEGLGTAGTRLPVVAIDGPSGAGKSSTGKKLAQLLGFRYIDTGALYRAVALVAQDAGVDWQDEARVAALVPDLPVAFLWQEGQNRILLAGVDQTPRIRSEALGLGASVVSSLATVREGLLEVQRALGRSGGVVMDGRDIGTVVFPDAELKIFLVADPHERALRRCLELEARGTHSVLDQVEADLLERDRRDMTRQSAPLRQAPDAILVDTTCATLDEVVSQIANLVRQRMPSTSA